MRKKRAQTTKAKIVSAAWKLFYEQGYEDTTVDDIVYESGTSKGSFYHYFSGKDALLSSLSYLFDEKYEELTDTLTPDMSAEDKLLYLNHELFRLIENSISIELLARLLSSQLVTKSEKHLLDHDRTYYKLLRTIFMEGQQSGEFGAAFSVNEMVKTFALWERAILYDWCLVGGEYPLAEYGRRTMPLFLAGFRACEKK
jgi:AcrR family transcriptional regulator